jgi:hypothetical protein
MSFTRRRIDLTFKLGTGSFGEDGTDTLTLTGLRCSADINATGISMSTLDLNVFGMTLDQMNKLTILNTLFYTDLRFNNVQVSAGSDDQMSVIFEGNIIEAWADFSNIPDVSFHVTANCGALDALKPVQPTSYKGAVNITTMLENIAATMTPPRKFNSNGVSVTLHDVYLPGTLGDQIKKLCSMAAIDYYDDGTTLSVYSNSGSAENFGLVEISPETGMVGYPAFAQNAIYVKSLFNPLIVFGTLAKVTSSLPVASKTLRVNAVSHTLSSESPNGPWYTTASLVIYGQDAPVPSI